MYCFALLKNKFTLSALISTVMLLTKENALAYVALAYVFCCLCQDPVNRKAWLLKSGKMFLMPYLGFGLFLIIKFYIFHNTILWVRLRSTDADNHLYFWPDTSLANQSLLALVMNFNWLFVLMILVIHIVSMFRRDRPSLPQHHAALFLLLIMASGVSLGLRHYNNVRYFSIFNSALIFLFY